MKSEDESAGSYTDVCKRFKELCEGAKNVIYERLVFNRRSQQEGERIDNFVSELKRLALTCEFGSLKDSLIRDRIVGGVVSDDLRGELLKKPDLTLQRAHDHCRTYEASALQKRKFSFPVTSGAFTTQVQPLKKHDNGKPDSPIHRRKNVTQSCKFCGYRHSFSHPTRCPAFKKNCRNCSKQGHFARMCPKPQTRNENQLSTVIPENMPDSEKCDESQMVHTYFGSVEIDTLSKSSKKDKSMVSLRIAGKYTKI